MRINVFRNFFLVLVYALLAIFVWENRRLVFDAPAIEGVEPTVLREALQSQFLFQDLGLTTGEVMLGFLGLLTLLYLLFAVGLRTSSLVESRRYLKEVDTARKLADEAEASRVVALQEHIDGMLEALRGEAEERHNMMAAVLGEIEDRIEGLGPSASQPVLPAPNQDSDALSDDAPVA